MPLWLITWLLLASGCNKLFDLEYVEPGGSGSGTDGGGSGSNGDADNDGNVDLDASFGGCVTQPQFPHDEDNDQIDDSCDGCPTQTSTAVDNDGDGLPNECDRNATTADEIKRVWLFATSSDTAGLTLTNATYNGLGNGSLQLGTSATVVTIDSFLPTRIEVNVRGASPVSSAGKLSVALPTLVACEVTAKACTSAADNTCGTVVPSANTGGTLGTSISSLKRVVFHDSSGARCEISNGGATVNGNGTATFAPNSIEITTNTDLTVFVDSIVIYGLQ
jgi:hypothetical protein